MLVKGDRYDQYVRPGMDFTEEELERYESSRGLLRQQGILVIGEPTSQSFAEAMDEETGRTVELTALDLRSMATCKNTDEFFSALIDDIRSRSPSRKVLRSIPTTPMDSDDVLDELDL